MKLKQALVNRLLAQGASALNVKVMEIQTSADPAVSWLRARQLCHLDGDTPQSGDGMKDDLTEKSNEALSEWEEEHQKQSPTNSGADRCWRFLWPCDSMDGCAQRRDCGWLAKAQATARVDVPTAPRQCCVFSSSFFDSLLSSLFLSLRHRNPKGT